MIGETDKEPIIGVIRGYAKARLYAELIRSATAADPKGVLGRRPPLRLYPSCVESTSSAPPRARKGSVLADQTMANVAARIIGGMTRTANY